MAQERKEKDMVTKKTETPYEKPEVKKEGSLRDLTAAPVSPV